MAYSVENTLAAQQEMAQAFDDNKFEKFNQSYIGFLEQFDSFKAARASTVTDVPSRNAMFGQNAFYLKQTTDDQGQRMLENARAVSHAMGAVPIADRLEFLKILEEKVDKYEEAIKTAITADTGKPMELSKGEMVKGKEWFTYARAQLESQLGDSHVGKLTNRHRPLGAAQIIGAYNYPYALAIGGIVGALSAGNGVIVSAPMKALNWVFPFTQAAQEAAKEFALQAKLNNKPYADELLANIDGLVQTSIGINTKLTSSVDVVHFVGSDKIGEIIRSSRGSKPTILEMGGSNVVTVMDSAREKMPSEYIAQTIYAGFGPATGQRCTAPRILCPQEGTETVVKELARLCDEGPKTGEIGNPFRKDVKIGPLVDRGAHQSMKEAIDLAHELGAEVHGTMNVGNNKVPVAGQMESYWVNPIVIDWSKAKLDKREDLDRVTKCMRTEIFGPLLHITPPVTTLDEAIRVTKNLDSHGLAAAIFTNSEADIAHFENELKVTSLAVNAAPKDQSPNGPHGHPGLATIGGQHHFELYSSSATTARMM